MTKRKLTKNTIKPVIRFLTEEWPASIYSFNTTNGNYYHFTLDYYNGKPSWQGGFAYDIHGCFSYDGVPYDDYCLNMATGAVFSLNTFNEAFNINDIKKVKALK